MTPFDGPLPKFATTSDELAYFDDLFTQAGGEYKVPTFLAATLIKRWGRLPVHCSVYEDLPLPTPAQPMTFRDPAKGAQWKRERNRYGRASC